MFGIIGKALSWTGQTLVTGAEVGIKAVVLKPLGLDSEIDDWQEIKKCSDLKIGDHVCQYLDAGFFVQGIVIEVSTEIECFTFIRYVLFPDDKDKATILPQTVNLKEYTCEKAIYSREYFTPDEVVQRAYYRVNERNYNKVFNFGRAFPRWCKTGSGGLTSLDISVKRTMVEARVSDLNPGDHVAFEKVQGFYHHAIVTEVMDGRVNVIEYVNKKDGRESGIFIKENIINNSEKMYKLQYKHSDEPDVVVKRAKDIAMIYQDTKKSDSLRKKYSYWLLTKNCEHLATWCKTGNWYSAQVRNGIAEALEHVLGINGHIVFNIVARDIEGLILYFMDLRIDFIVNNVDIFGVAFFLGIEMLLLFKDSYYFKKIYREAKDENERKQICKEYEKKIQRRMCIVAGAWTGSFIGSIFGPVGTAIGGTIGSLAGELLDWLINTLQRMDKPDFIKWLENKARQTREDMEYITKNECPQLRTFLQKYTITT